MDWTSRLIYVLVLTAVTGGVLTLVWYVVGSILEKSGYLNIFYWMLRVILFFWYVPLSYFTLKTMNAQSGLWDGKLFLGTPQMRDPIRWVIIAWTLGVIGFGIYYLCCNIYMHSCIKQALPCDVKTKKIFYSVCEELGISRERISIKWSYRAKTPCVAGVIHQVVILPDCSYEEKELYYILMHELVHVKHRDQLAKNATLFLRCVYFFNPLIWLYFHWLEMWCEYACDYKVCVTTGETKEYFEVVLSMVEVEGQGSFLTTNLVRKKSLVQKRMDRVTRSLKMKKKSKLTMVAAIGCIFALSGSTVFAATNEVADKAVEIYEATVPNTENLADLYLPGNELIEYTEAEMDSNVVMEEGEVVDKGKGTSKTFYWTVLDSCIKYTPSFYLKAGQGVIVGTAATPTNKTYRMGVINPDATKTYVVGTRALNHNFVVSQTGFYRVYVHNQTTTTLTIDGNYLTFE